ncbi:MAG TPA: TetR/AcrR family transcriptional regulator [Rhizobiaceae bacterium]|nr:TetR/AcrR family transcriptional regulator [Rhizobiaceae bacterium]
MHELDYVRYLERRLAEARGARKTVRTEIKIEIAAARLLAERGYHKISVDQIAETAGLAHGTIYRYFSSKSELVAKTLSDYFDFVRATRPVIPRDASTYEAIYIANLHYVRCFQRNVGLMKCHFHVKDQEEVIAEVGRRANERMVARVIRNHQRRHDCDAVELSRFRLSVYGLVGMVDELLVKIYGQTNPPLAEYADQPELVATILSELWFNSLYGNSSPAQARPAAINPTS